MFDESIDHYNVYKVETIGDAYLVASGLPTFYDRHAQEMSHLALELLESVKQHIIPHLPQKTIQLRIGIHSGWSIFSKSYINFTDHFSGPGTKQPVDLCMCVCVCVRAFG